MPRYPKKSVSKKKTSSYKSLSRQVKTLSKKMTQKLQSVQFLTTNSFNTSQSDPTMNFANAQILTNYSQWQYLFPGIPNTFVAGSTPKMYHRYTTVDITWKKDGPLTAKETSDVDATFYLVSPKDSRGHIDSNHPLASTIDYSTYEGKTWLNLKNFKVHSMRRMTLTSDDSGPNEFRFQMKAKMNASVLNTGNYMNSSASWKEMNYSPDPSDNLYLLIFTNDFSLDAESTHITYSALHSINL